MSEATPEYYTPDAAFLGGLSSGSAVFGGVALAKFSTSRKIAAEKMGCMAPANFAPDSLEAFRSTLQYPGLHGDVINILWLCTLSDDVTTAEQYRDPNYFTPDRAIDRPDGARKAARAWAETETVGLADKTSPNFEPAWKLFLNLVFSIDASLFDVAPEDRNGTRPPPEPPPPKTPPGPLTSPSSSRARRKHPGTTPPSSGKK